MGVKADAKIDAVKFGFKAICADITCYFGLMGSNLSFEKLYKDVLYFFLCFAMIDANVPRLAFLCT